MCPETTGKEAIAVSIVNDIAAMGPCGDEGTGHHLGPVLDVTSCIANNGRLAGRARGRMNPDDLVERLGKQAVGVVVAHVLLQGKRQALQIIQSF